MTDVQLRALAIAEADRIVDIDRAEEIDGVYVMAAGHLVLRPASISVVGWHPVEVRDYPERVRDVVATGGAAFGAFIGDRLVGIGVLDVTPVGGDPTVMALDLLHVGAGLRGQGIGTRLTALVIGRARALGATALSISATPTRNTVDAYQRMGARVLTEPDPEKFALEPEDIHLILPIEEETQPSPCAASQAGSGVVFSTTSIIVPAGSLT